MKGLRVGLMLGWVFSLASVQAGDGYWERMYSRNRASQEGDGQGYKIRHSDLSANTTNARVLVAPSKTASALTIRRIRVSNGSTSQGPSYIFMSRSSMYTEGESEAASPCTLPSCFNVAAVEAVRRGTIYDLTDLNVLLPVGHRLEVYATADISVESKGATFEVWYEERDAKRN